MKANELREFSKEELVHRLEEIEENLFKLRFRVMANVTDNPSEIKKSKREKARVLTILKEKELESNTSEETK